MARNKKSEKEKEIAGTSRSDRAIVVASAMTLHDVPKTPRGFTTGQKKLWKTVCQQLIDSGILIPADMPTIEMYVKDLELYTRAYTEVYAQPIVMLANGVETTNPWYKIMQNSGTAANRYAGVLGLTPRSRAQLMQFFKKTEDGGNDPLSGQ